MLDPNPPNYPALALRHPLHLAVCATLLPLLIYDLVEGSGGWLVGLALMEIFYYAAVPRMRMFREWADHYVVTEALNAELDAARERLARAPEETTRYGRLAESVAKVRHAMLLSEGEERMRLSAALETLGALQSRFLELAADRHRLGELFTDKHLGDVAFALKTLIEEGPRGPSEAARATHEERVRTLTERRDMTQRGIERAQAIEDQLTLLADTIPLTVEQTLTPPDPEAGVALLDELADQRDTRSHTRAVMDTVSAAGVDANQDRLLAPRHVTKKANHND